MLKNSITLLRLGLLAVSIMAAAFFVAYATLESRIANLKEQVEPEGMAIAQEPDYRLKSLIYKNCENRELASRLVRLSVRNSDAVMRLRHYTSGHAPNAPFCPECGDGRGDVLPDLIKEDYSMLRENMSQAIQDSYEMGESLETLHLEMTQHYICLQANLKALRKKSKEGR